MRAIDPEDAVPITVERHRHAVRENVRVQTVHVTQRRLGRHEAQLGQLARGNVN